MVGEFEESNHSSVQSEKFFKSSLDLGYILPLLQLLLGILNLN